MTTSSGITAAEQDWDLAEAQVAEPTAEQVQAATQAQIDMRANPVLAERTGVVSGLVAAGMHEPIGATTQPSSLNSFSVVSAPRKTPAPRGSHHVAVTLQVEEGRRQAVTSVLSRMAGRRDVKTVVVDQQAKASGSMIELSVQPNRDEMAALAALGVKFFAQGGREIPAPAVKRDAPSKDFI